MSVYFNYTRGSQWADSGSILLPQSARRIGANEMAPRSAGGVGVFAHRLDGEIDKIPKTRTPPGTASAFSRMDRKGLMGENHQGECKYTRNTHILFTGKQSSNHK
jgi:hypothetical protein